VNRSGLDVTCPRSLYRRLRRIVRCARGLDIQFPVQIDVPVVSLGTEYGAWSICPGRLDRNSVVYSVGIGTDISFDLALIERFGVAVHAFDPTPGSIAWLAAQPLPARFTWHQVGLAAYDGQATFFPPENPEWISHTMLARTAARGKAIQVEVRRVSSLMRDLGHERLDVLKMDIEGAEYDVVDDILASGVDIGQLLIEFHHRFSDVGIERTRQAVATLNAAGYRIFFTSDSGEEYGFMRRG
jgi:FkbM family methyltransferase